jgi:uncharacterized protein YaeQ
MALPSTRLEYRLTLSNVDRGVDRKHNLIVAQHPSETLEHVTLRVLAWCLLHEDRLEMGPGLSDPDAPDLWTRDLTGRATTWIECGAADADKLRKILQHNPGVAVHVVLCEPRRHADLLEALSTWKKPPRGSLTLWLIDRSLVSSLSAREDRRQSWTVTIVGNHVYVETDTPLTIDGAIDQSAAM